MPKINVPGFKFDIPISYVTGEPITEWPGVLTPEQMGRKGTSSLTESKVIPVILIQPIRRGNQLLARQIRRERGKIL